MKHTSQDIIKEFLHKEITDTAKELHLTNEQMSELLDISTRSYGYIKSGRNSCSSVALLYYLVKVCPNTSEFIRKVKHIIQ